MTIIAVSSILLASLGGGMVFAQELKATTVVEATPIITFNDVTLDVTLDADGVGSIEFSDLVDGTTVTTENRGTNVIQFILNPVGPYSGVNPNNLGVAHGLPFQIRDFETDTHTVVYNKTHFTFNLDNPTFSGATPSIRFQASLHSAADVLPVEASDIADITFNIVGFVAAPTPAITFNDATVPITLDADGVGSIEFSDLVDGTIVTTENIGSNVIQFTLDPTGIYSFRNPDNSGVADERAFQIPSFETDAHTVVYNKTHFTFDFDDETFTGDVPTIRFQASLHSAADILPIVDNDRADITFSIAGFDDTPTPAITFNDATVPITLDADGVGSIEFSDLIDGTIVTTENRGSNVIQFSLDPAGPHNAYNPNNLGVANETPFQIPSFETDAHTVVYNKTHFTFDFDDVTFSGSAPNVSFQASLHSAADALPALATDLANIQFNIIGAPEICQSSIGTVSLDFGALGVGIESADGTVPVTNTGNMASNVTIGADPWCDASVNGCLTGNTVNPSVMEPSTTHFSAEPNVAYATKTPFNDFVFNLNTLPPSRATIDLPITNPLQYTPLEDSTLFSLIPGTNSTGTAYLQVSIDLIPEADDSPSRFTGDVTQEIWLTTGCSSP